MATETSRDRTSERAAIVRLLATPPKDSLLAGWKAGINQKTNISFFLRSMINVFTWSAWLINNSRFPSVLSYPFGIVISSTSSTVSPKPGLKVCWPPRSLRNSSKVCVFCIKISNKKKNRSVTKNKKYAVLKLTITEIAANDCKAITPCSGGAGSQYFRRVSWRFLFARQNLSMTKSLFHKVFHTNWDDLKKQETPLFKFN